MTKPSFLFHGSIGELHHAGVLYFDNNPCDSNKEPVVFQKIREFWEGLGMCCITRFAEVSPDGAGAGWRLYVGDVAHQEQLSYRPAVREVAELVRKALTGLPGSGLRVLMENINHCCFQVNAPEFAALREHEAAHPDLARWRTSQGRVSVRLRGPIGEDLEFYCPYIDPELIGD